MGLVTRDSRSLCVSVCMCNVHVCGGVHSTCERACIDQRSITSTVPQSTVSLGGCLFVWSRGLSLFWNSLVQPGQLRNTPQGDACIYFSSTEIASVQSHSHYFTQVLGSKLRSPCLQFSLLGPEMAHLNYQLDWTEKLQGTSAHALDTCNNEITKALT